METLLYDGSFPGWLTAVFEVYEYKQANVVIRPAITASQSLFGQTRIVITSEAKATRVWKGLQTRISRRGARMFYNTFLSEEKAIEDKLLQYVQYAFSKKLTIEHDYAHPAVQKVIDTDKIVRREKHRMEAFVRFQRTADNLWFAAVSPDFNVLPLIKGHFEERYADQTWLIYDLLRKYGIHYNGQSTIPVELDFNEDFRPGQTPTTAQHSSSPSADNQPASGPGAAAQHPGSIMHPDEEQYRILWQHYFNNVNIPARKNLRLHLRHMPTRYWKFLPEKQPAVRR